MKIAICDNSQTDAHILSDYACSDIHSVRVYQGGNELCGAISDGERFALIFLDIDMPGMNGIETAKCIRTLDKDVVIVFVTSFAQYALEAFECEAFHYLLKPVTKDRITTLISRVEDKLNRHSHFHTIKFKGKTIRLPVSDIFFVECLRKHVIYHTEDRSYDTIGNISDAYKSLCEYNFIQIHQGYIVNMEKIADFDDKFVILDNGKKVEISVRKRKETLLRYAEFLERYI